MSVIGVDFDGTIVPFLPEGHSLADTGAEKVLRELVDKGHEIILVSCRNNSLDNPFNYVNGVLREESSLGEAIRWFVERKIPLSGINISPKQKTIIGDSQKPLVDILIDDTNLGTKLKTMTVDYVSPSTGEIIPGYKTHCVDWSWVRRELIKKGIL